MYVDAIARRGIHTLMQSQSESSIHIKAGDGATINVPVGNLGTRIQGLTVDDMIQRLTAPGQHRPALVNDNLWEAPQVNGNQDRQPRFQLPGDAQRPASEYDVSLERRARPLASYSAPADSTHVFTSHSQLLRFVEAVRQRHGPLAAFKAASAINEAAIRGSGAVGAADDPPVHVPRKLLEGLYGADYRYA